MKPQREQLFFQAQEQYGASLRRVARSYARSEEERKDLQQEIALALWDALARFQGDCTLRTFAFRVAHNCCISKALRKRGMQPEEAEDVEAIPSPGIHAEQALAQKQGQQRLLRAVRGLPLKYRQVVSLALEELPHAEIASVVGISQSNVAVRLNRAKGMLRQALDEGKR